MRTFTTSTRSKLVLGLATAAIVLPLAACSSNGDGEVVAKVDTLTGQSTSVALDKGFVDALTSLKLTPGVVGDATLADGAVSFPITGGNVTYYKPGSTDPYVQGVIDHDGSGLSLTAGDTEVDLTNFVIDPGTSELHGDVSVNGKPAATDALLFNLDGSTLEPLATGPNNTAILAGTTVTLSDDAAALLGDTFKTDAVKGGLVIGISTITINAS
ncbi:MAG: hypothetical protein WKF54_01965 [Nocardioidaceae bacterium]